MSEETLHILVVDDERSIRRYLHTSLEAKGHRVIEASGGVEALGLSNSEHPDLIILDLGLPDMDGIEVVRQLRERTKTPIIILSVRDREDDKVGALDAGADDYLTKPFGLSELMARIRAAMRHAVHTEAEQFYEAGDLKVDLVKHEVLRGGEHIALTPTEYDLLRVMVQNQGRVLTHNQLLRQVWGSAYEEEAHLLRVNVSNLRRKIEPNPDRPEFVLTEPGVGYRFRVKEANR